MKSVNYSTKWKNREENKPTTKIKNMEHFLYYLLRASVVMALFYGFYKLFFGKNTFHRINRIMLILMTIAVYILPLFRFSLIPKKKQETILTETFTFDFSEIPIVEYNTEPRTIIPWQQILLVLFIIGLTFTVIRYFIGLAQLRQIIRKSEKRNMADNSILCITEKNISPFSWFNYIVLSINDMTSENRAVINHERAHIHLFHSLDMIFFDMFTCIFWFNPFSWLLRREIQSVHEYQADEQVINNGIDAKQYQLLLIRKSVGEHKFALANNFRQRDLHKRIKMMTKNRTNKQMKWGYSAAFPVLLLAMVALSVPKLNAKVAEKEIESTSETEIITTQTEDSVIIVDAPIDLSKNPLELGEAQILSKDNSNFSISLDEKLTVSGYYAKRKVSKGKPLYILNGTQIIESLEDINPDSIKSITVLKDKSAADIYGKKGENGVVVIITKNGNELREKVAETKIIAEESDLSLRGIPDDKKPLIIIDGEVKEPDFKLNSIEPSEIDSMEILKNKSAIKMYGEKGKNGVILIVTKSNKTLH